MEIFEGLSLLTQVVLRMPILSWLLLCLLKQERKICNIYICYHKDIKERKLCTWSTGHV